MLTGRLIVFPWPDPIIDRLGRPLGILEVSGIVHYLVQHFPKTIYNLPPVAHPVMHDREGP